ncbi:MAG: ABC transporter permease subunit [Acidobacteria bacterium]|nr:ABC transporter permease subunit [Acidobacteriota bacterium]
MNWQRVREIIRKELLQVFRDKRMRFVLFGPPMIQTIVFGFAVNLDVQHVSIAWMDGDRTSESRDLLESFTASGYFEVVATPERDEQLRTLLDRGEVMGAVTVLPGFARALERGESAPVQVIVDGANSNTASIVRAYAAQTLSLFADRQEARRQNRLQLARGQGGGSPVPSELPGVALRSRVWFNPNLLSRNYFIPGVIANILALVTLMLTAMGIVREKEIGTMEQLMVTPIRPLELIIGKTLPFALVGLADVLAMTGLAYLVFGIELRGSVAVLLLASSLYLLTTLGVGVFISTVTSTQQQAMMSTFFVFMPLFMLSGFAFPISSMPTAVQYLTLLNPVRHFMSCVRALFLKGVGVDAIWPQLLALLAIGLTVMVLSAARFHKRLD